jgi:hypothetical protein
VARRVYSTLGTRFSPLDVSAIEQLGLTLVSSRITSS